MEMERPLLSATTGVSPPDIYLIEVEAHDVVTAYHNDVEIGSMPGYGSDAGSTCQTTKYSKTVNRRAGLSSINMIFQTPTAFNWWFTAWLAILHILCIALVAVVFVDSSYNKNWSSAGLQRASFSVLFLLLFFLFIYGVVVPKRIEVYENASIVVVTWLFRFRFEHVREAYKDTSLRCHPVLKFSTSRAKRVRVARSQGWFDVMVSPANTAGFMDAVWRAALNNNNLMPIIRRV